VSRENSEENRKAIIHRSRENKPMPAMKEQASGWGCAKFELLCKQRTASSVRIWASKRALAQNTLSRQPTMIGGYGALSPSDWCTPPIRRLFSTAMHAECRTRFSNFNGWLSPWDPRPKLDSAAKPPVLKVVRIRLGSDFSAGGTSFVD